VPNLPADACPVSTIPAAAPAEAEAHFARLLTLETDCWDVHEAIKRGPLAFTILDVRSVEAYARGHLPQAISLPHGRIHERNLADFPMGTLFVVYCSGPHCNGADKAAWKLARLKRPVKKMLGGVTGWLDEGFSLVRKDSPIV